MIDDNSAKIAEIEDSIDRPRRPAKGSQGASDSDDDNMGQDLKHPEDLAREAVDGMFGGQNIPTTASLR